MCMQQWEDTADMLESVLGVGPLLQYQSFWFVFEPQRRSLSNSI